MWAGNPVPETVVVPPIDVSLDRLMARRVKLKFYEAGMDMGWSSNVTESFRMFQGRVLEEYDRIVGEFSQTVGRARQIATGRTQRARQRNTLFAQRRNLLRPGFYRMLRDILRLHSQAGALVSAPEGVTLGERVIRPAQVRVAQ